MALPNAYAQYNNSKVLTASPAELTLMLYEGAIKFCNVAIDAVERKDIAKAHTNIVKVENIIDYLRKTLDMKYPVAQDFERMYVYLDQRLVEANVKKDVEILEEIRDHLHAIRDNWKEVMRVKRERKSMIDNYLGILEDSLHKKLDVLEEITAYNKQQEELLKKDTVSMEELDTNMEQKDVLIQKLTELDEGFETLYERIREQLLTNKDAYKDQIRRIQGLISKVTEKGVSIKAQETRNKKLVEDYFIRERRELQKGRNASRTAYGYYKNMSGNNVIPPQFMDQKK